MNRATFLEQVLNRRQTQDRTPFKRWVEELDGFDSAVQSIYNDSISWAKAVGIIKEKEPEKKDTRKLSYEESIVKDFFSSRSLSPETTRDYADLIELVLKLVGKDGLVSPHKFISISTKKGLSFGDSFWRDSPGWLVVIPIGNSNSHDYELGRPHLHTPINGLGGFTQYGGSYGNNMTHRPSELRAPTFEEVKDCVANILYRNRDVVYIFADKFYDEYEENDER